MSWVYRLTGLPVWPVSRWQPLWGDLFRANRQTGKLANQIYLGSLSKQRKHRPM